jgi:endonuclease YncB( thermonuclease family)
MANTAFKPTKALEVKGTITMGHFKFGMRNNAHGTPKQEVHDGDTVGQSTALNFSTRFLGIDTPEVSFTIRTTNTFVPIGNAKWVAFWTSGEWKNMPLDPTLSSHLAGRIGDGTLVASNHKALADAARQELIALIEADMAASGKDKESFWFFHAYSYEVLDRYARILCYLHSERANFDPPSQAGKLSYNEQLLKSGAAAPYFIFPNIQPFMKNGPFDAVNLAPAGFWSAIDGAKKLQDARKAVAAARAAGHGIFDSANPLILLPYEIRFIARKGSKGPDRHVIDLGQNGSNQILPPEKYDTIAKLEDRLFIPKEFVPLFLLNGWKQA